MRRGTIRRGTLTRRGLPDDRPRMSLRGFSAALLLSMLLAAPSAAAEWTPRGYAGASTIELRTVAAGEGEHWFPVWVVVIDDQVYVRLGPRAAGRIEKNQAAPYVGVRILGQQFERVRSEPAPDYAERVAKAMAAKYWSDLIVHHFSHPLTLRLVAEPLRDGLSAEHQGPLEAPREVAAPPRPYAEREGKGRGHRRPELRRAHGEGRAGKDGRAVGE